MALWCLSDRVNDGASSFPLVPAQLRVLIPATVCCGIFPKFVKTPFALLLRRNPLTSFRSGGISGLGGHISLAFSSLSSIAAIALSPESAPSALFVNLLQVSGSRRPIRGAS